MRYQTRTALRTRAVVLYKQGLSTTQIAERLGISYASAYKLKPKPPKQPDKK